MLIIALIIYLNMLDIYKIILRYILHTNFCSFFSISKLIKLHFSKYCITKSCCKNPYQMKFTALRLKSFFVIFFGNIENIIAKYFISLTISVAQYESEICRQYVYKIRKSSKRTIYLTVWLDFYDAHW